MYTCSYVFLLCNANPIENHIQLHSIHWQWCFKKICTNKHHIQCKQRCNMLYNAMDLSAIFRWNIIQTRMQTPLLGSTGFVTLMRYWATQWRQCYMTQAARRQSQNVAFCIICTWLERPFQTVPRLLLLYTIATSYVVEKQLVFQFYRIIDFGFFTHWKIQFQKWFLVLYRGVHT